MNQKDVDRFNARVNRADDSKGCWLWAGSEFNNKGYGRFSTWAGGRKRYLAHRLAYELSNGPIDPGLVVRHRCDKPACCNPDHMELGTQAQNIADMHERNRFNDSGLQAGWKAKKDSHAALVSRVEDMHQEGLVPAEIAGVVGIDRIHLYEAMRRAGRQDLSRLFHKKRFADGATTYEQRRQLLKRHKEAA